MEFGFFKATSRIQQHNKYVLIMIEHFSKWTELVALHNKFSEGVANSFLNWMLIYYGVPTEILTDQGSKLLWEFQALCKQAIIDHHTTSKVHLKVDGWWNAWWKGLWK